MSDTFIARWSRLKRGPDAAADTVSLDVPSRADGPARRGTDELPDDLREVDPALLPPSFDFARLMRDDVPAAFRASGLRRLWSLSAVSLAPDGLDIHCEDYNDPSFTARNPERSEKPD